MSCKEKEDDVTFTVWEDTYGYGSAYAVGETSDNLIVSCGTVSGNSFVVKLNENRIPLFTFSSVRKGCFTDFVDDNDNIVVAGSNGEAMLISLLDNHGRQTWDMLLDASFDIDVTSLCPLSDDTYLAIGSGSVDSLSDNSGILFVKFDKEGNVQSRYEYTESYPIYVEDAAIDNMGNIYLATSRLFNETSTSSMASMFSSDLTKKWEVALYNNPNFSSSSLGVKYDSSKDAIYISGKTETSFGDKTADNSFIFCLNASDGQQLWKAYREKANAGVDIAFNGDGNIYMQNSNCFVISVVNAVDGENVGVVRLFDACDSYTSTEIATSIDMCEDGNLLVGGSKSSLYFLALKRSDVVSMY